VPSRTARWAALAALTAAPMSGARADAVRWVAAPGRGEIVVNVFRKGLFSNLAHDHHFVAGRFRVAATLDDARGVVGPFEVEVDAASLRDRQPELSDADREKVDAQAASAEVLDAARFPAIRLAPGPAPEAPLRRTADGSLEGSLEGVLSLHGRSRPVAVPVHAAREGPGWRVRGAARFLQSDFGIEPYSGFLGTVGVHDEVEVAFDLFLVPAP